MTEDTNIPANSILDGFPEPTRYGFEFGFSHTQWRRNFVKDWQDGHVEWLPAGTDPAVVRRVGDLFADSLVRWLQHCLDHFFNGIDEEEHLLRDLLIDKGLIPDLDEDGNPFDEECDTLGCEAIVPDGSGYYPDGDEGRRVCATCAGQVP
jgi:hypothetical protein